MDINKLQLKHFLIISIIVTVVSIPAVYAGVTFDIERKNLSQDTSNEKIPEITAAGNSVYVVWFNSTSSKLQFTNSTDKGVTFDSPIDLGSLTSSTNNSHDPQIVVKEGDTEPENKLFVVWVDGTNIKIRNSTNNGDTFNAEIDIGDVDETSSSTNVGGFPKIANSSSDKVYVTWLEDDDAGDLGYTVKFINSTSGGSFANAAINIDTDIDDRTRSAPAIVANGTNVYLVWASDNIDGAASPNPQIKFVNSTDSGATFGDTIVVGTHGGIISNQAKHANPAIAVNGTKVYLAWLNSTGTSATTKIKFINGSDSGSVTFPDSVIDLGAGKLNGGEDAGPEIAIGSGGNVYVVWVDNDKQIQFRRSTNSGDTFETAQVLDTGTGTVSTNPQIATAGDSVYVVWEEGTGNDRDIILRTSGNTCTGFSSQVDLSSNTNSTTVPKLSALGDKVYVVWEEQPSSGTAGEIKFSAGTFTETTLTLNQTQYRLSDAVKITICDPDSNVLAGVAEEIKVNVTSTTTPKGNTLGAINYTLREDDLNSGVFTGTVTLSETTTSDTALKVSAGDSLNAFFGGISGSATIFPITIGFNGTSGEPTGKNSFTLDQFAFLRVVDGNSNTSATLPLETIDVTLSSQKAPSDTNNPTTITLIETGVKTGIFGGSSGNTIIFMSNHTTFPLDNSITSSHTRSIISDFGIGFRNFISNVAVFLNPTSSIVRLMYSKNPFSSFVWN